MHDVNVFHFAQLADWPMNVEYPSVFGYGVRPFTLTSLRSTKPHLELAILIDHKGIPGSVLIPIPRGARSNNRIGGILRPMNGIKRNRVADLEGVVLFFFLPLQSGLPMPRNTCDRRHRP